MGEYAARFLHPDLSLTHLRAVGQGALETLAMSGMGTLSAMLLGLLLALPAAGRFGWPLQGAARLLQISPDGTRTPELAPPSMPRTASGAPAMVKVNARTAP